MHIDLFWGEAFSPILTIHFHLEWSVSVRTRPTRLDNLGR